MNIRQKLTSAICIALGMLLAVSTYAQSNDCAAGASGDRCREDKAAEAYWDEYGDRYSEWQSELAFDPYFYFLQPQWEKDEADRNFPLVMAGFSGFKVSPWAFAIEPVCTSYHPLDPGDCSPKLRIVTFKRIEDLPDHKLPSGFHPFHPKSRDEMANYLSILAKWQEADLRSCKGAIGQLEQLDDHSERLWDKKYRKWLKGAKTNARSDSGEIIVTTDGNGTWLEARSRPDPGENEIYPESNQMRRWIGRNGHGFAAAWTARMLAVVKPCLKPAIAPPPWQNALVAHHQWNSK